jgi:hypothetical protein
MHPAQIQFEPVLANREDRKSDTPPLGSDAAIAASIVVHDGSRTTGADRRSFTTFTKRNGRRIMPAAVWPGQGHFL